MKKFIFIVLLLQACGTKPTAPAITQAEPIKAPPSYCSTHDCNAIALSLIDAAKEFRCGPNGACNRGQIEFESKKCNLEYSYCCSNGGAFYGVSDLASKTEATFAEDLFSNQFTVQTSVDFPEMATGTKEIDELKKAIVFGLDNNFCN